jgi:hypothetical protein
VTQTAASLMKEKSIAGSIINIASVVGRYAKHCLLAYTLLKRWKT